MGNTLPGSIGCLYFRSLVSTTHGQSCCRSFERSLSAVQELGKKHSTFILQSINQSINFIYTRLQCYNVFKTKQNRTEVKEDTMKKSTAQMAKDGETGGGEGVVGGEVDGGK